MFWDCFQTIRECFETFREYLQMFREHRERFMMRRESLTIRVERFGRVRENIREGLQRFEESTDERSGPNGSPPVVVEMQ